LAVPFIVCILFPVLTDGIATVSRCCIDWEIPHVFIEERELVIRIDNGVVITSVITIAVTTGFTIAVTTGFTIAVTTGFTIGVTTGFTIAVTTIFGF